MPHKTGEVKKCETIQLLIKNGPAGVGAPRDPAHKTEKNMGTVMIPAAGDPFTAAKPAELEERLARLDGAARSPADGRR
jgi:hypothetical protein